MRKKLEAYVELLFAGNPEAEEIRQEILQNTLDHYDDLLAEGRTPEAAYSLAIAGIGDVSELLEGNPAPAAPRPAREREPDKLKRAVAVALFILCPVPLFILQNEIGLSLLLLLVAAGTALLILAGRGVRITRSEMTPRQKKESAIIGIVWLTGAVIYLLLSVLTRAWGVTWLIFPMLAAISGIIHAITDLKEAENNEK